MEAAAVRTPADLVVRSPVKKWNYKLLTKYESIWIYPVHCDYMSLSEMRQQIIDFGEKYRGKTFEQAFQNTMWAEWFVLTCAKSNKTAHQRFLIFVEKQLDAETMSPEPGSNQVRVLAA